MPITSTSVRTGAKGVCSTAGAKWGVMAGLWPPHSGFSKPSAPAGGEIIRAVRDDEQRVKSLGHFAARYKLMAFVLSAGLAGLAGSMKVLVFGVASLTDVHWHASGEVVLMSLLGGIGTLLGPIAGALAFVSIQNTLAPLGSWVLIVQGLIFILCVLLFRECLVGLATQAWNWLAPSRSSGKA
ncbi:branched-chain amino acid ABC transporter permease [Verminephrobacter eiseniae]|uniref:branched-chain amino acid ABC transporter permease n=1 Tax=Verminephrobacter eiseniae TaxID=364317 RepID=UPI002238B6BA|nr:hypothetical protein [Verminephrobacter eiseniae]